MNDDRELLRRYAAEGSEPAFAELVQRHLRLVYHTALRLCGGDVHRAQDVTQAVFTDLARKAASLGRRPVLVGWLYTSTRYAAAHAVRGESRRQKREQEAHAMNEIFADAEVDSAAEWERLRPVIDAALHALSVRDREAVLLRFFEGQPFVEVGAKLAVSEDAARVRVDRALQKMRSVLARRGVTSTTAALTIALANQVAATVPAGLAATVSGAALAGATASAGTFATVLTFMSMTKIQLGISSALAVAGATGFALQQQTQTQLRREIAELQQQNQQIAALHTDNERLSRRAAEVAGLRGDDAEFTRLSAEAAALKSRAQTEMAAALAEQARKNASELAAKSRNAAKSQLDVQSATVDRFPKPTFRAAPAYPAELYKLGIEGEVVVSFVVGSDGLVHDAVAARSTRPEFEASALEAVSQWKFDPGVKGGRQVNTRLEIPINFKVDENSARLGAMEGVEGAATWF
ncbi:MAG: TonB family protein [Opitutus sp.]